ncbi:cation:proton antiporter [Schlegelella sp. S2-27]|uniref:Cation:proton antiporter n=1 Tax=Caldimonas mangrovi TaxID=2944811 RepID=A0ABT0YPV9_9BURK|nr:cation:proton antiporter [Caldimonas mangrovi]MCM5680770.1 cation:proton antiporter [Caldimonas mangrovi]
MFTTWCLLIGLLLILMGLTDTLLKRLPVSASALYLLAGYLLGNDVYGLLQLDLMRDAKLIEHLSEVAVLVSLFAVGLRLRVRLSDPLWRAPVLLATVAMALTIGVMTLAGLAFGLSLGAALLLAAVLAPTDPVLASDVQVKNIHDRDRLRFSLTGEGGLNDGTAFPFVMLALGLLGVHDLGPHALRWWGVDVLWATTAGLLLGWAIGCGFSRAVVYLRRERQQAVGMESFLTLGLIAVSYGLALSIHAYGFLAVFAAGLAMRHVEHVDRAGRVGPDGCEVPQADPRDTCAYMAKEVLDFTLDLEKLVELTVMLMVGGLLSNWAFSAMHVALGLTLILVARPLAIWLTTHFFRWTNTERALAAWFGIRGVGSVYYLAFAVSHGAHGDDIPLVVHAVLVSIVLSVLLHGSSATAVMDLYRRSRAARRRPPRGR